MDLGCDVGEAELEVVGMGWTTAMTFCFSVSALSEVSVSGSQVVRRDAVFWLSSEKLSSLAADQSDAKTLTPVESVDDNHLKDGVDWGKRHFKSLQVFLEDNCWNSSSQIVCVTFLPRLFLPQTLEVQWVCKCLICKYLPGWCKLDFNTRNALYNYRETQFITQESQ